MTSATSTDDLTERDPIKELWKRQLVLTAVAIAVGAVALKLMQLSIDREADVAQVVLANGNTLRSASYLATMWPAAIAILAVALVFAVLLVHAYRVASFTFRRGVSS